MALEKVREAVLNAARREAALIVQKAQEAADAQRAHALQAAEAEAEQEFERQTRLIREEQAQALLQARAQVRRQVLERQNQVVNAVFDRLRERLLNLPQGRYASLMSRLIQQAAAGKSGKIRVHPQERPVFDEILNHLVSEAKLQVVIDTSQPLEQPGGFIFVSDLYEVDYTVDALMEALRREWAPRVAGRLFSHGGASA